jgi:hypothetical protein
LIDTRSESGPFSKLYEAWFSADPPKSDGVLEVQLAASYREAWERNVGSDRYYVLDFIYDRKDQEGADLIVEGLGSDDPHVVRQAAVLTSVAHGLRQLDLGPGARAAYRAMVRRFPDNDTGRPREFYGHQPGDVDDTAARPFVNLYEDWMATEYPRDPGIAQALAGSFRDAWATGDGVDRAFVLHFITSHRPRNSHAPPVHGVEFVGEALGTDDPRLAKTAAFSAWVLLDDGIDLGPDVRNRLEALRRRFPDCGTCVWSALRALDKLESAAT